MTNTILQDYYERNSADVDAVLFRARRVTQSAEWNDQRAIHDAKLKRLADSLYSDGNRISGCEVKVDPVSGAATLGNGAVYVRGDIRGVPPAAFTVPATGVVEIGVYLHTDLITEADDPTLLNPVPGETYHAKGAARRVMTLSWGWRAAGQNDGQSGDFYRVFGVTDGVLDSVAPPPQLTGVQMALARYDRAITSGGTYVVKGLSVQALAVAEGRQIFSLAEGAAHVDGFEVTKVAATPLAFPVDPDLFAVESEPHTYLPDISGTMRLEVVNAPLAALGEVRMTAERAEVQLVHGGYTGAADALPDQSVLQIMPGTVRQGGTTYTEGTDYRLLNGRIDWTPGGAEPTPGSTYTLTYRYMTDAQVSAVDDDGCTVTGAVPGTVIFVDYSHKLPRFDRLVMDREGTVARIRGVADLHGPALPPVPGALLLLATLRQDWRGVPEVILDAPRLMTTAELRRVEQRLASVEELVAIERLKTDARATEPAGSHGLFVDGFFDNEMRDAGIAQTAAVIGGEVVLPIRPLFAETPVKDAALLNYALEPVIAQEQATNAIRVNPYDSFTPIPPTCAVEPPFDRWTENNEVWDTDTTSFVRSGHFVEGVSHVASSSTLEERVETVSSSDSMAQFLRRIPLTVTIAGLGHGEIVDEVRFDGQMVGSGMVAGADGKVVHTFTIPAGIPAGTKSIDVKARATGSASCTFTGAGIIHTEVRRRVKTVEEFHVDPVAESFTLEVGRHIGGVELLFRATGTSQVVVQLRDTVFGLPGTTVLAEARLAPGQIRTDGQPTRFEWEPVWIPPLQEHAFVVLCDDPDTEVAFAKVGDFDPTRQVYVSEQPYRVGVMYSSSNGTAWTVHQDSDLYFRLLGCRFQATSRVVPLGSLAAAEVSDLIALFNAERPSAATRITLKLTGPDGKTYTLTDGVTLSLSQRLTGAVSVQAILEGTDIHSPLLFPGVQAIFGVLTETATYVGRQFATAGGDRIRVILDAFTPGTAAIKVEVQAADASWIDLPVTAATPVGDGWEERVHLLPGFASPQTRIRLTLNGTPLYRPRARRLRAIAA